jgi:leucyl-tRNA synthetase
MSYDHKSVDPKWQKKWEDSGIFHADDKSKKEKLYLLVEFPYPSGAGLHVGHPRSYTALDILARKKRMEGKNVLFPMGWDAFGLPAENHAIKTGVHPSVNTKENIDNFRRQLKSIGFSFDWSREIDTTDPKYYRWTQWQFLQFFKAGLAYKAKAMINWCPKDKCGLANEEVVNGACERCGTPVEKKEKEQWMLAITKYADRLLEDLKDVDYLPKIKKQQEDWIGKSEGAEIDFELNFTHTPEANKNRGSNGEKAAIKVFTTRPDTICGATFLVLAPEHLWVTLATDGDHDVLENKKEVIAYLESVKGKTEIDRTNDDKEKTGIELKGVKAINPVTGEEIPMFVADYVLTGYGTGAIMAVPGHDERDNAFANKFDLPVKTVIEPFVVRMIGDDAVKPELPFAERRAAVCIVKHWSEEKYLISLYKKNGWKGFVTGGIEEDESASVAAVREVIEETGYQHPVAIAEHGKIHSQFYHAVKNVNRFAHFEVVALKLEDGEREEMAEEEKALHDVVWMTADEVGAAINREDIKAAWNMFQGGLYTGKGILVNSGKLDGLTSEEAFEKVGVKKTQYKLRDWVFSRQRYWGEPIPLIHCEKDGWVAVPDEQLPVELPKVEKYQPTDNGESPLALVSEFVNTECPTCGGPAKRETDTMPNWAGSSWYFLRYIDPNNDKAFADKKKLKYWMPVDLYNGGMEHTTLHLLYSRFWNKFLFDQGLVPFSEPYKRRHSHGLIMSEDGTKMSKSRGNVVNPDDIVNEHGADTLRVYEVFMGPFEEPVPWSTSGVIGVRRFLDKVVRLSEIAGVDLRVDPSNTHLQKLLHKTIKKVTDDIENFRFNTAVASLMTFVNEAQEAKSISKEDFAIFLKLLVPFAPHVSNELWEKMGNEGFAEAAEWPVAVQTMLVDANMTISVQVNGKLRSTVTVPADIDEAALIELAKSDEKVSKFMTGEIKKTIVVKGKIVNFVV